MQTHDGMQIGQRQEDALVVSFWSHIVGYARKSAEWDLFGQRVYPLSRAGKADDRWLLHLTSIGATALLQDFLMWQHPRWHQKDSQPARSAVGELMGLHGTAHDSLRFLTLIHALVSAYLWWQEEGTVAEMLQIPAGRTVGKRRSGRKSAAHYWIWKNMEGTRLPLLSMYCAHRCILNHPPWSRGFDSRTVPSLRFCNRCTNDACTAVDESMLHCSVCQACYCSPECQRTHWPTHKSFCRAVRLRDVRSGQGNPAPKNVKAAPITSEQRKDLKCAVQILVAERFYDHVSLGMHVFAMDACSDGEARAGTVFWMDSASPAERHEKSKLPGGDPVEEEEQEADVIVALRRRHVSEEMWGEIGTWLSASHQNFAAAVLHARGTATIMFVQTTADAPTVMHLPFVPLPDDRYLDRQAASACVFARTESLDAHFVPYLHPGTGWHGRFLTIP